MPELDELKAVATGGTEGRAAYREGREAVLSDQRTAIDEALGAATQRGASGPAQQALDAIIRPVGDAAAGRLDAGGAQFGKSTDALGGALGTFQSGASTAEGLAYDLAFSDADRARREREAREAEQQAEQQADDDEKLRKLMAPLLGEQNQAAALAEAETIAKTQTKEELRALGTRALQNLKDPRERDAAMTELLTAATAEEAAAVINRYAPDAIATPPSGPADASLLGRNAPGGGENPSVVPGFYREPGSRTAKPRVDTGMSRADWQAIAGIDRGDDGRSMGLLEELYSQLIPGFTRREREIGLAGDQFARDAYIEMGGDPFLAQTMFSDEAGRLGDFRSEQELEHFLATGQYLDDYEAALAAAEKEAELQREEEQELSAEDFMLETAASVGTSPGIVNRAANKVGVAREIVYGNLEPGTAGNEVVAQAVNNAIETIGGAAPGEDLDPIIADTALTVRDNAIERGVDPTVAEVLAQIAAEQIASYLKTYRR